MISFAKPVLTEDKYIVQKEECAIRTLDERPSIFVRNLALQVGGVSNLKTVKYGRKSHTRE
jgi:hypothetical protein